jgi:hypothetical protein
MLPGVVVRPSRAAAQRLRCILTTSKATLGYLVRGMAGDNRGTPKVLPNEIGYVVANGQEGHQYFPLP